MKRQDLPLGEIEEVRLCDQPAANEYLKKGWILLDAKVIQLSPESLQKAVAYCIVGRKGKSLLKKRIDELKKGDDRFD